MVTHAWHFDLLLLCIFIVILQDIKSVSSTNLKSGRRKSPYYYFRVIKPVVPPKEVPGFSLNEQEMRKFNIWPDGYIPYYIDVKSFSDKVLRDKIRSFLNNVNSITSLKFIELPSPPEDDLTRWVFFINRRGLLGCADHSVWNFTFEGVQRVVLGYDCMNREGELPEAVLAIAGVPAQHTAPDRDEYIEVFMDNVIPDKRKLFEKLSDGDWLFHDLPYDYDSAGHYHNFKYSMNGKTVIEPRKPNITIGENKELSEIDILKIRLLYNFITQKRQLSLPECQKLFKPGRKLKNFFFRQFEHDPRKKPVKYTGVQQKHDSDAEHNDNEKAFSEQQSAENNENQRPDDYQNEPNAEVTEPETVMINFPSSENEINGTKKLRKKRKPKLKTNNVKDSKEILPLKAHLKDPLEDLSDYSNDKTEDRRDWILKVKNETLKNVENKTYR